MKKVIIALCIVVSGFIIFFVQEEFGGNKTEDGIDKLFSGQIYDHAKEEFTVHAMGLSGEKVFTVRIAEAQYKEQAKEYFRDILNSHYMESYGLEVFVDDLTLE
ncbi:hypothetical protein MKY09_04575 [Psychrobacillus sp. FSL K6-4046]|uniref:hypothetical protein n=1 Tax=Psychrobacillus sp. FSL K6-4046 TaxID=2921550 RepID=UPI00315A5B40